MPHIQVSSDLKMTDDGHCLQNLANESCSYVDNNTIKIAFITNYYTEERKTACDIGERYQMVIM